MNLVHEVGSSAGGGASGQKGRWMAYPLRLVEKEPGEGLCSCWQSWLPQMREPGRGEGLWVPVGVCGPLLLLGHWNATACNPPLPTGCFQPVLLSIEDYQRRLEQVRAGGLGVPGSVPAPNVGMGRRIPSQYVRPVGRRAAARFLLEYFPLCQEIRPSLEGLAAGRELCLPSGLELALYHVSGQGPVADADSFVPVDLPESLDGVKLPASISLVGVQGRVVWLAGNERARSAQEDRILDALGDGWRMVWLRTQGGDDETSAVLASVRRRRMAGAFPNGGRPATGVGEQGEIILDERMCRELERVDSSQTAPDPAKIFLRELSAAVRCGASDLHVEPGSHVGRIRARVDGVLEEWLEMGAELAQAVVGAAKELAGLPAERYVPQDGCCTIVHCGESVGARVSAYPIRRRGQKLVFRLLPKRGAVPPLSTLLNKQQAAVLMRAASAPQGLVLVCGPTGSGKTTTLFSVLAELNTATRNITTMEDPVEYVVEGLNQAELDPLRGADWDVLLKGFLRQDPDVGLLGEIRDRSTAETAIRQALTGHVVLASLHTLSCARTIERLLDMGVGVDMLASSLSLIVSQRLVRRLCPSCKVRVDPRHEERTLLESHGLAGVDSLWEAAPGGCPHCRAGYRGRVAAMELLPVTPEVASLVEGRARASSYEGWMRKAGLPSLYEAALKLAVQGEVSLGEAREWEPLWENFEWSRDT